jgi:hypothetical protein
MIPALVDGRLPAGEWTAQRDRDGQGKGIVVIDLEEFEP